MNQLFEWAPPHWVPPDAWQAFVENRHHIAKVRKTARWTDLARDRAIQKLDALRQRGIDIREVLLTAAEHGWQDVDNAADHVMRHAAKHSGREGFAPASKQGNALAVMQGMKR